MVLPFQWIVCYPGSFGDAQTQTAYSILRLGKEASLIPNLTFIISKALMFYDAFTQSSKTGSDDVVVLATEGLPSPALGRRDVGDSSIS